LFKKKATEGELTPKFKARLVAQGYGQKNVNYDDVFSAVIDKTSLRYLMHFIASRNMHCFKFDVSTAFLNATLDEEVYVKLPEQIFPESAGCVFRLLKALYGLKRSPIAWQRELSAKFRSFGFVENAKDPCLYIKYDNERILAICGVHVDDGLVGCLNERIAGELQAFLNTAYEVKLTPFPRYYLGINLEWRRNQSLCVINQSDFIVQLVQKFGVGNMSEAKIPISSLERLEPKKEDEPITSAPYRELIGALIYISTCTRPDISFAVNTHAQHFGHPTNRHYDSALKILSYLNGTKELGLHLGGRKEDKIICYCDADFANDETTRLSVTGNLVYIGDSLVSWTSKRQKLIATSSTEAEFLAVFYTLKDLSFIQQLVMSVLKKENLDTLLHQDNQSTIAIIKNANSRGRTKHFDVKLKAVNSAYKNGQFQIQYCKSEDMWADVLTKVISRNKIMKVRRFLVK
jgi:predicted nucleic acid-binding Zn finger protein